MKDRLKKELLRQGMRGYNYFAIMSLFNEMELEYELKMIEKLPTDVPEELDDYYLDAIDTLCAEADVKAEDSIHKLYRVTVDSEEVAAILNAYKQEILALQVEQCLD